MRNLVAIWVLCCWVPAWAATWYVDNAATGSRNGTSWANAWTNLNAIAGVAAGDTVFISGGSTSKTYLDPYWVPAGGTDGNPITYKVGQDTGHNGVVIFDGSANVSWLYDAVKNVTISGDYAGLTNLVTTNCTGTPVHCDGAYKLTLDHVQIYGEARFNPGTNLTLSHCLVRARAPNTYCVLFSAVGLTASPTNNLIRNCTFQMPICSATPAWGSDGIKGGVSMTVVSNLFETYGVANNTEFEHCDGLQNIGTGNNVRVHANRFRNISNYAIYWEMQGSVSNAWFFNNLFDYTDASIASGLTLALSIGQRTAGSTISNLVVANNTIVDHYGRAGITMGDDPGEANTWQNCLVANNLTVNSGPTAAIQISLTGGGTNGIGILRNKAIAWTSGSTNVTPSQLVYPTWNTNLLVAAYSPLSAVNDMRPASGDSSIRDDGFDLSAYFTTDAAGNTRSSPWDIGAYEYTEASASSGPTAVVGTASFGTLILR